MSNRVMRGRVGTYRPRCRPGQSYGERCSRGPWSGRRRRHCAWSCGSMSSPRSSPGPGDRYFHPRYHYLESPRVSAKHSRIRAVARASVSDFLGYAGAPTEEIVEVLEGKIESALHSTSTHTKWQSRWLGPAIAPDANRPDEAEAMSGQLCERGVDVVCVRTGAGGGTSTYLGGDRHLVAVLYRPSRRRWGRSQKVGEGKRTENARRPGWRMRFFLCSDRSRRGSLVVVSTAKTFGRPVAPIP